MYIMTNYNNKYGIPSARATLWDYGFATLYFITTCTKTGNIILVTL